MKKGAGWYIPEKAMAPHSSTLAWKIPWTEERHRLQSMGSLRVRHDWATSLSLFTFMHWRRKWQPLQCSCLENPRDSRPGGLPSMGLHRVRHDWSDLEAAAAAGIFSGDGHTGVGGVVLLSSYFYNVWKSIGLVFSLQKPVFYPLGSKALYQSFCYGICYKFLLCFVKIYILDSLLYLKIRSSK